MREIDAKYTTEVRETCERLEELVLDLAKARVDDDYYEVKKLRTKIDGAVEDLVALVHEVWEGGIVVDEEDAA